MSADSALMASNPPPEPTPPPRTSRLVAVEYLHHTAPDGTPSTFTTRFACPAGVDQPYVRRVPNLGAAMTDGGWYNPCKGLWFDAELVQMVVVSNHGIDLPQGQPDEWMKARAATAVVEVAIHDFALVAMAALPIVFAHVRPGDSLRLSPAHANALRLRSAYPETRITVALFPRP